MIYKLNLMTSPLCPLCRTDIHHNTTPLQLQTHTHSVDILGFVNEPRGDGQPAGTMEQQRGRRTNHWTIGLPLCYGWW